MKLSDRDLKLIIVLLIALVLALPYIIFAKPTKEKIQTVESEITTLQARLDYLNGLNQQRQFYIDETARLGIARTDIINQFPAGINQENVIMFIQDVESYIPMWIQAIAFGTNVYTPISAPKQEGEEGLTAIVNTSSLNYECNYDDFKFFLEYIMNYNDRMVLSSVRIDLASDPDTEVTFLTGDFVLNQYAISGEGREYPAADIPEIIHGSDNVFMSDIIENGNPEDTDVEGPQTENVDYDYFIRINPAGTEEGTKIIGKGGDLSGDSWITNKSNSAQSVVIKFMENDGVYRVNYKLGTTKYPTKDYVLGEEFIPVGTNIILNVFSSKREDENDVTSIKVKVINETDKEVEMNILDEDVDNPRIQITDTQGTVNVNGLVVPSDSE